MTVNLYALRFMTGISLIGAGIILTTNIVFSVGLMVAGMFFDRWHLKEYDKILRKRYDAPDLQ